MTMMALEETEGLVNRVEDQLKTVVIYSDQSAAAKAMALKQRLLRQFISGSPMRTAWWALESLKDEVLFEASCRHAAEADLLFLALTVSDQLPPEAVTWLDTVFLKNARPSLALVALLGTMGKLPAEVNPLDNYLHAQARNAGIEYFIYWHQQMPATASFLNNHHHAPAISPTCLTGTMEYEGVPRWGINE